MSNLKLPLLLDDEDHVANNESEDEMPELETPSPRDDYAPLPIDRKFDFNFVPIPPPQPVPDHIINDFPLPGFSVGSHFPSWTHDTSAIARRLEMMTFPSDTGNDNKFASHVQEVGDGGTGIQIFQNTDDDAHDDAADNDYEEALMRSAPPEFLNEFVPLENAPNPVMEEVD
jgi:hypothetical protein